MTFLVYEIGALSGRHEHARFSQFDAAEAYVQSLNPVAYERDDDYPGCGDAFLPTGICVHIDQID